jgi:hypothetical protein
MDESLEHRVCRYNDMYEITSCGKVFSYHQNKYLKPGVVSGYERVAIRNNQTKKYYYFGVHRLVADAYLENPNNYKIVNHRDKNRRNNKVENLEWCTIKMNNQHSAKTRTKYNSYKRKVLKFDNEGNFVKKYNSITEAANENNVTISQITSVCKGRRKSCAGSTWKYQEKDVTEEMIKIPEFANYFATKSGKIFSKKSNKFLVPYETKAGYLKISIRSSEGVFTKVVHRLVAECYLPKIKDKNIVNHKNGNKKDNRIENLEWCTSQENTAHSNDITVNRKIFQIDIESGEVIDEYVSIADAALKTKISGCNILQACRRRFESAGDYGWEYG